MVDMNTLRVAGSYASMYAKMLFVPGHALKLSRLNSSDTWPIEYKKASASASLAHIFFLLSLGLAILMSWGLRRVAPDSRAFSLLKTGRTLHVIGASYFAIFVAVRLCQARLDYQQRLSRLKREQGSHIG